MKVNLDNLKPERVAIISDPHLDHKREFVWKERGFKSPEEHKEKILSDLDVLNEKDFLICLGDLFLNTSKESVFEALDRIKARTLLIWGNHPAGIKELYKEEIEKQYNGHFLFSRNCKELNINKEVYPLEIHPNKWMMGNDFYFTFKGKTYYCNHFPQIIWEGMQYNVPCLAGHSHGGFDQVNPNSNHFGKVMDCGVDNALKYVGRSFFWIEEIDEFMKKKERKIWDHHGS